MSFVVVFCCCVLVFGVARGGLLVVVRCSLFVVSPGFVARFPLLVV